MIREIRGRLLFAQPATSEILAEFSRSQASLSQDRAQDARAQVSWMHRNRDQEVSSFHTQMASRLAHLVEAEAFESSNQPARRGDGSSGNSAHPEDYLEREEADEVLRLIKTRILFSRHRPQVGMLLSIQPSR